MKKLLIAAALVLSACANNPRPVPPSVVPVEMPALPPELSVKAERLPDITDPSMGAIVIDAVETDKKYNKVARQNNALIDVYNCVKVSLKDRTDPKKCLSDILE